MEGIEVGPGPEVVVKFLNIVKIMKLVCAGNSRYF
jgi:hypothetical protein